MFTTGQHFKYSRTVVILLRNSLDNVTKLTLQKCPIFGSNILKFQHNGLANNCWSIAYMKFLRNDRQKKKQALGKNISYLIHKNRQISVKLHSIFLSEYDERMEIFGLVFN